MLRLLGIPISNDDARHLVATLLVEGTPDALTAAAQLTKGVERDPYAVGLTREERAAVRRSLMWHARKLAHAAVALLEAQAVASVVVRMTLAISVQMPSPANASRPMWSSVPPST